MTFEYYYDLYLIKIQATSLVYGEQKKNTMHFRVGRFQAQGYSNLPVPKYYKNSSNPKFKGNTR